MPSYPPSHTTTLHFFDATVRLKYSGGFLITALISPSTVYEKSAFDDTTQVTVAAALNSWEAVRVEWPLSQSVAFEKATVTLRTPPDSDGRVVGSTVTIVSSGIGLTATVERDHKVQASQSVDSVMQGIQLGIDDLTNAYAAPASAEAEYLYSSSF
jgi:hypothetical protein